jgi:hypothetical protein
MYHAMIFAKTSTIQYNTDYCNIPCLLGYQKFVLVQLVLVLASGLNCIHDCQDNQRLIEFHVLVELQPVGILQTHQLISINYDSVMQQLVATESEKIM